MTDEKETEKIVSEAKRTTKAFRFLMASVWIIAAFAGFCILYVYACIGTNAVMEQAKYSGDSLGYCFLVVTLYGSHLIVIGYILITGIMWIIDIFNEDFQNIGTHISNWVKSHELKIVRKEP